MNQIRCYGDLLTKASLYQCHILYVYLCRYMEMWYRGRRTWFPPWRSWPVCRRRHGNTCRSHSTPHCVSPRTSALQYFDGVYMLEFGHLMYAGFLGVPFLINGWRSDIWNTFFLELLHGDHVPWYKVEVMT